jgi:RNA recognition motif-containing protein
MPRSRSRSRSRSATSSPKRSRSPVSDHEGGNDRPNANEHRIHIADLPQGVQESEVRKQFQRYGTLVDVWVASASCFAFVVYKQKEEAQKAIDSMDGRYER